ncbi:GAK system ATP-grasp enzyme [Nitrincola sp. A-D6]|uniref:GAK system ATP-grasp enzyme n=1 Tax=Nitrincola sp. A-D6 TaxID=1545442 RepID=UPI001F35CC5F|nr:GAK system ATP-grasp enzyme [Nitrincola sp. A-D6]
MSKPRIAVIGNPGKWSTEVLATALQQRTGFRLIADLSQTALDLSSGRLMFEQHNLCELDGIIIRKVGTDYSPICIERLEMLRVAEHAGVRVFSSASSLIRLLDRLTCTVTLHNHQIPMPPTLVTESVETALQQVQHWGSAILKPLFSTKARGMQILHADQGSKALEAELIRYKTRHPLLYLQQHIDLQGADMGLVFINGEYQGAYARIADKKAWNTTIHSGGRYAPCEPSPEAIDVAHRAQAAFDLDYATVDVAMSQDGPWYLRFQRLAASRVPIPAVISTWRHAWPIMRSTL